MPTIFTMTLEQQLEDFGFSNKKARVYLALLELGTARANEVAKKANLERPTTYDTLEKLIHEGYISYLEKRGVRYYMAEFPEKIEGKLLEKQKMFQQILPNLLSLYSNSTVNKPKIRFYEGLAGIKSIFADTLTTKNKRLRAMLSMYDTFIVPGRHYMEDYINRRIEEKIQLRVIRPSPKEIQTQYWPSVPSELREVRFPPAGIEYSMSLYIYDNKVALISSQKENFGMIIESQDFSEMIGHLFEALWQVSQPV